MEMTAAKDRGELVLSCHYKLPKMRNGVIVDEVVTTIVTIADFDCTHLLPFYFERF